VQVKPTVPLQPSIDFGVLVSAVIVQDQMDLRPVGRFAIDRAHELDELGAAVPGKPLADHRAGQHVQGRQQRRGDVARVVVGPWCPPDPQPSATRPASDPGLAWLPFPAWRWPRVPCFAGYTIARLLGAGAMGSGARRVGLV
jgi:hypothetical protein